MPEPTQDTASKASEFVKDTASNVSQATKAAGSSFAAKADDAAAAVGGEMRSLADNIRAKAPHDGMVGNTSSAVAQALESYGRELEQGLNVVAKDMTNVIRRHPIPAIVVGVGLGFLMMRMMMKS